MPIPSDPQFPLEDFLPIVQGCMHVLGVDLLKQSLQYIETEADEPSRPKKGLFVGKCMTKLEGKANPVLVNTVLDFLLTEYGLFHALLMFKINCQEIPSPSLISPMREFVEQVVVEHLKTRFS